MWIVFTLMTMYLVVGLAQLPWASRVAYQAVANPPPGEYYPWWHVPLMLFISVWIWPYFHYRARQLIRQKEQHHRSFEELRQQIRSDPKREERVRRYFEEMLGEQEEHDEGDTRQEGDTDDDYPEEP